jgi:hypothetical protein
MDAGPYLGVLFAAAAEHWTWLVAASLAGFAVGWSSYASGRRRAARQ